MAKPGLKAPGASRGRWRDEGRQARRDAQQRATTGGGGGGGGGNVEAWPVHHNKQTFWPPDGLPVPHADGTEGKFVLTGREMFLRKGSDQLVILPGIHRFAYGHGPQKFMDRTVLPRMLQSAKTTTDRLAAQHYECTFDGDLRASDHGDVHEALEDGWQPHSEWEEGPGDDGLGEFTLPDGHFTTKVIGSADGYTVQPPRALRYPDPDTYGPYETAEEACWVAEGMNRQAKSCGFCAQKQLEWVDRWDKDDSLVYDPRQTVFLVMFSLRWLYGESNADEKKAGYYKFSPNADDEPEGSDRAVREGWGWLRSWPKKTNKGSSYRTFEEYAKYQADLACTCSNCLTENGGRAGRRDHDIAISSFCCEHCGGELLSARTLAPAPNFRAVAPDDNGNVKWAAAGLFQLFNEYEDTCPHCKATTYGEPSLECSSCDNPMPIMPHQVLTQYSRDMDGGYYKFEMVEAEDGRIFYDDWSHLAATAGGDVADKEGNTIISDDLQEILAPAFDALVNNTFVEEYFDPTKSKSLAQLTPRQQCRLIGSEVFEEQGGHAEKR